MFRIILFPIKDVAKNLSIKGEFLRRSLTESSTGSVFLYLAEILASFYADSVRSISPMSRFIYLDGKKVALTNFRTKVLSNCGSVSIKFLHSQTNLLRIQLIPQQNLAYDRGWSMT